MNRNIRKSSTFAAVTVAAFLATASVAFACVTFKGQMTVDGNDRDTWVKGTGNSHGYCSDGRPTTAAAGGVAENLTLRVSKADCNDPGASGTGHKLDAGTYQVRYNSASSYTFDGTYWNMIGGTGCFRPGNSFTLLGTFTVNSNGDGAWTGPMTGVPLGDPTVDQVANPDIVGNLCVGDPAGPSGAGGPPGLLAPFELVI